MLFAHRVTSVEEQVKELLEPFQVIGKRYWYKDPPMLAFVHRQGAKYSSLWTSVSISFSVILLYYIPKGKGMQMIDPNPYNAHMIPPSYSLQFYCPVKENTT